MKICTRLTVIIKRIWNKVDARNKHAKKSSRSIFIKQFRGALSRSCLRSKFDVIERSTYIRGAARYDSRDESGRPKQSGQRKAKGANAMVIGEKYTHRRINHANNLYTLWPSRKEFRYHKIFATATVGAQKCARARTSVHPRSFFPLKTVVCVRALIVCRRYASLLYFVLFFFFNTLSFPLPLSSSCRFKGRSRREGGLLSIDGSIAREATPLVLCLKCRIQSSSPELKNSWIK